jgi:hypothetical protein
MKSSFILDDWGIETKPGDYVMHHLPSSDPGKDMICSRVVALHGKQTIEVDLQHWDYAYPTGHYWKNVTTARFIKVDEEFAKKHYDVEHAKSTYSDPKSFNRFVME